MAIVCNSYDCIIGQNLFTHKKHTLKKEIKYIIFRKLPFCRFVPSVCENENIPI